jgi:hypothetical protein
VRSFDLKVEPGGRKGFVTPCIFLYIVSEIDNTLEKIVVDCFYQMKIQKTENEILE